MARWENTDATTGMSEVYDLATGYTRKLPDGSVAETRPLTAEEIAALTPQPRPLTAEERLVAMREALAALDTIAAPVLNADVLDVLVDVRNALEA